MSDNDRSTNEPRPGKPPILGQGHGLSDHEGDMIKQLNREEQHSARPLNIPPKDLADDSGIAQLKSLRVRFGKRLIGGLFVGV